MNERYYLVTTINAHQRLNVSEVRKLYEYLYSKEPAWAEAVAIGYYTGLRLSDVTELDETEVSQECTHLSIVPNKTRKS